MLASNPPAEGSTRRALAPYMNRLYIGFHKDVVVPKSRYLFIHDEVPDVPRARIFDPLKHCFNPLKDIDYKTARELASVLYTITPQGQDTLTVRNGRRGLLRALLKGGRFDKINGEEEVTGMVDDLLVSPVLRRVLCYPKDQFSFNPNAVVLARLDRKELGEFDALVLGLFLMARSKGQVVVPDFGFYGREMHASLIRDERLIAGINSFGELSLRLKQNVLSIKDKKAEGAIFEDAKLLAEYAGLIPGTNGFNEFVANAM